MVAQGRGVGANLIAMCAKPLAGVIMEFVLKPHCDAIPVVCPADLPRSKGTSIVMH